MLIREAGNSSQPIKAINLSVWNGLHSLSSATKYPKIPIAMDANHCFKSEKKVNFIKNWRDTSHLRGVCVILQHLPTAVTKLLHRLRSLILLAVTIITPITIGYPKMMTMMTMTSWTRASWMCSQLPQPRPRQKLPLNPSLLVGWNNDGSQQNKLNETFKFDS